MIAETIEDHVCHLQDVFDTFSAHGLRSSNGELVILSTIANAPHGVLLQDLQEVLSTAYSPNGMHAVLRRLESKGLISRRYDSESDDRRLTRLHSTARGRRVVRNIAKALLPARA